MTPAPLARLVRDVLDSLQAERHSRPKLDRPLEDRIEGHWITLLEGSAWHVPRARQATPKPSASAGAVEPAR